MAGKAILPLLLAVGAGAVLLSKKKPTTQKKKKGGVSNDVVASGKVERTGIPKGPGDNPLAYEWRVRSASSYLAEAGRPETLRDPVVTKWTGIGEADTVEDATDMALAWIDQQPGYEQDVNVVDSGTNKLEDGGQWEWRVISDPQRGFVGQYKIGDGTWFSAVEGANYDDAFKYKIFDIADKDYWSKKEG